LRKNSFAEISKNLAKYKFENIFIDHQNNYVETQTLMLQKVLTF